MSQKCPRHKPKCLTFYVHTSGILSPYRREGYNIYLLYICVYTHVSDHYNRDRITRFFRIGISSRNLNFFCCTHYITRFFRIGFSLINSKLYFCFHYIICYIYAYMFYDYNNIFAFLPFYN